MLPEAGLVVESYFAAVGVVEISDGSAEGTREGCSSLAINIYRSGQYLSRGFLHTRTLVKGTETTA